MGQTIVNDEYCNLTIFYRIRSDRKLNSKNCVAIFHLLNNFIWYFAGNITSLIEMSELTDLNSNCSSSRWALFLFTQFFWRAHGSISCWVNLSEKNQCKQFAFQQKVKTRGFSNSLLPLRDIPLIRSLWKRYQKVC